MKSTITAHEAPVRSAERETALYVVLDAARPLDGSARFSLAHVDEVRIGRGDARGAERFRDDAGRTLRILLPDGRVSGQHARIARIGGDWVLADLGSKNGVRVNGATETRARLAPGDLVEIGETTLLFADEERVPEAPEDAESSTLVSALPGIATLLPAFARELARLAAVAHSDVPLVIRGETGTGKEVVARALHDLSERRGRFVAVNCGALPGNLVESELFGYRKGAFSGATEDRPGLIRAADLGTLFLDEIGDLAEASQAVLLRVLQEKEVRGVGATQAVGVDVRVLCATHRDLGELVASGRFRADLLARLAGYTVTLPALRERRGDLGLLVAALLTRLAPERANTVSFAPDAARALLRHDWPLNVRELEQCLRAALPLASGSPITTEHLPALLADRPAVAVRHADLLPEDAALRDDLTERLRRLGGNLTAVAKEMGKDRKQIRRWVKRFGLGRGG